MAQTDNKPKPKDPAVVKRRRARALKRSRRNNGQNPDGSWPQTK